MIRRYFIATLVCGLLSSSCASARAAPADWEEGYGTDYEYDYGYDDTQSGMFASLDVYGSWHHVSAFGWVWRPYVSSGWRPYSHGHWTWTNYGWMWVGYEPFAWAAYHYGYWTLHPRMGWVWIPDYEWAACRVEWIVYDDYVCWAPLPPPHVDIGYPWSPTRVNVWITVRAEHFTASNVTRYSVKPKFKSTYATAQHRAPEVRTVARFKGSPVKKVDVEVFKSRAGGHEVTRVKLPPGQKRVVDRHRVKVEKKPQAESNRPTHPANERNAREGKSRGKEKGKKSRGGGDRS